MCVYLMCTLQDDGSVGWVNLPVDEVASKEPEELRSYLRDECFFDKDVVFQVVALETCPPTFNPKEDGPEYDILPVSWDSSYDDVVRNIKHGAHNFACWRVDKLAPQVSWEGCKGGNGCADGMCRTCCLQWLYNVMFRGVFYSISNVCHQRLIYHSPAG